MDDKRSQLRDALERLHTELEQTRGIDEESRVLLRHLDGDIQAVLKEPTAATRASLGKRLNEAMDHFEESHPALTLTIKQVLDNLAGI
jgi:hypothetical protein